LTFRIACIAHAFRIENQREVRRIVAEYARGPGSDVLRELNDNSTSSIIIQSLMLYTVDDWADQMEGDSPVDSEFILAFCLANNVQIQVVSGTRQNHLVEVYPNGVNVRSPLELPTLWHHQTQRTFFLLGPPHVVDADAHVVDEGEDE
jgi:hypothetical protein